MKARELKRLEEVIQNITEHADQTVSKGFDPDFTTRVLVRLNSFVSKCDKCVTHQRDLAKAINKMGREEQELTRQDFKLLQKEMDRAVAHLQNRHRLVVRGQSLAMGIAVGLSLGVALGLVFFKNIALGLVFGVALGVAFGVGRDSGAKKKDRMI